MLSDPSAILVSPKPGRRVDGRIFKIGLLADGTTSSKYVFELARWIALRDDMQAVLILHPANRAIADRPFRGQLTRLFRHGRRFGVLPTLSRLFSKILFRGIVGLERIRLKKNVRHTDHFSSFDLLSVVSKNIAIAPIISKSGFVYRFSEPDIQRVKDLDCDILVRCGSGILKGGILSAARFGILSFHHADNRINRGIPAAFWEVYSRQETTGFTIQVLTEELDGGIVLMRGHLPTRSYFQLNEASVYERSNYYLKVLINGIVSRGTLPDALPSVPYSDRLYRYPNTWQTVTYALNQLSYRARNMANRLRGRDLRWGVAFLHSVWRGAALWRGVEIRNPPFHFLADPFVVTKGGKSFCFMEDFDYMRGRGEIAVYELCEDRAVRAGVALSEAFHLSFPYIFEYQGQLFMCPETHKNRDIRIYRCHDFPLGWTLERVIMQNVSAGDTMIFERNGRWWMFTNIDPVDGDDHCSELSIFHAASPFGDWTPHTNNPILVDASRARNAGLLRDGEKLFRVSQGQGFDLYGRQALINEILELTESTYREDCVAQVTPHFKNDICGTHHMHSDGSITVFDYLRRSLISS
ncbi:MAG: hypothetical protein ABSE22_09805 [Xanthobacteraceae bacterium]|jgi:hypothetical protein